MQLGRKLRATVGVATSLLLTGIAVVPALASRTAPHLAPIDASVSLSRVPTNATSTAWGGWVFTAKGVASDTTEFKIPTLKCTSIMTGIGPGAFMLTGTTTSPRFNGAAVVLGCIGGRPAAQPEVVVDGVASFASNALFVGDLMKATVTTSSTKTAATIQDLTTGHKFTFTRSGSGASSFQEMLIDDNVQSSGHQLPVVNFGTIPFSAGAVGGKPLGSVAARTAVNMETATKVVQILTGGLTGTSKNAFLTTWKHS